jgi:hypothetical protein
LHQLSNILLNVAMSHDQAVKEASAKHTTPAELVGKFQYGTAGVSCYMNLMLCTQC